MTTDMEIDEIEKKDEKEEENGKLDETNEKTQHDSDLSTFTNLKEWCTQLEKGEIHVIPRMMQLLPKTRKQINSNILQKVINTQLHNSPKSREMLLKLLLQPQSAVTTSDSTNSPQITTSLSDNMAKSRSPRNTRRQINAANVQPCAEVEIYIHLLLLVYLMDQNELLAAKKCAAITIGRLDSYEKRSLDSLAAKVFFFLSLIYERAGRQSCLRSALNSRLRTATLRRHSDSQAVLINCLLRIYLQEKQYQAAAKLVSKITFPEGASNNDLARFLYYQGRIKAMQLDYTAAAGYFMQAMRKAPQDSAIGFKQNVQKWVVVISLLQGEIPERSVFRVPIHRKTLMPYLELTQAVRLGDVQMFNHVLDKHAKGVFEPDETLTLIVRLRQNVIRTALRQISTAYSCISISDIRKKLLLQTDQEAEYLIAKAIKDGNIEAVITSDSSINGRFMQSKETEDIYRTVEPQFHFDTRIRYCLELHNQAVKALRYPAKSTKGIVESIEEQREREEQDISEEKIKNSLISGLL